MILVFIPMLMFMYVCKHYSNSNGDDVEYQVCLLEDEHQTHVGQGQMLDSPICEICFDDDDDDDNGDDYDNDDDYEDEEKSNLDSPDSEITNGVHCNL